MFPVCVRVCVFTVRFDCEVWVGGCFDLHCVVVEAVRVCVCVCVCVVQLVQKLSE